MWQKSMLAEASRDTEGLKLCPLTGKKKKKAGAPDLLGKLPGRLMASDPRPCSAISISVALSWQLGLVKKAVPCLSDAGDSSIQNDRVRLRRKTPPISRPTPARHVHGADVTASAVLRG